MRICLLFIQSMLIATLLNAQTTATFRQLGPIKFPANPSIQTTGMGRVSQLAYHPTDSNIMYAVSASGGVYRSANQGITWLPISDQLPLTNCASILINPLNPNIIYLGTGDANYNTTDFGVYKSYNGGKTWAASNSGMGNKLVSKMVMPSNDTATIIAACSDGIYKSTNSGLTWVKKSTINTSYRDLHYRPQSTQIMYAASNAHFYRSFNGGDTWSQININSSITSAGIKIGVCPSDTGKLYAVIWKSGATSPFGGVYQSTNNGGTFTLQADTPNILGYSSTGATMDGQGAYNLCIEVDPNNSNTIYIGAINLWKSINGGSSFTLLSPWAFGVHADKHHFLFSPYNSNKLFIAHDGGLDVTTNGGTSWTTLEDGLTASEFYKMGASELYGGHVIGGLQDNGLDVSVDRKFATIRGGDFTKDFAFDLFDSALVYDFDGRKRNINTYTNTLMNAHGGIFLPHPKDSNVMFEMDTLFRRTKNLRVSPSTNMIWDTLVSISGINKTGTKCLAFAKASNATLYFAYQPQLFYKSENINAVSPTFTKITTFPFATSEVIKQIETCDYDSNVLYVVTNQSRLYKSANKGLTWVLLNKNLPSVSFVKFKLDQAKTDSSMYLCTAVNIYYRDSSTGNWITFASGMPSVASITDMEIYSEPNQTGSLFISTYGRGIWQTNLYNDATLPPVANFNIEPNSSQSCVNQVMLVDHSTQAPTAGYWQIKPKTGWQYINNSDSSMLRAEVVFTTTGTYYISRVVTNSNGMNMLTKIHHYSSLTAPNCVTTTTTQGSPYGIGISKFELRDINVSSGLTGASNKDYTCAGNTLLKPNTTYVAKITTGTTNFISQQLYIDYNGNQVFTDANELVGSTVSGIGVRTITFTTPANPGVVNQFVRLRVVTDIGSAFGSCGTLSYGESEDYAVKIDNQLPVITLKMPKPNFSTPSYTATLHSSEPLQGFTLSDIVMTNGVASGLTQIEDTAYSFIVTPITYGNVIVQINANSMFDFAGNVNGLIKDTTVYVYPAIATATSTATTQFGPNDIDTVYTVDGKIMAVLTNLSSFDFGLTTINIDSANTPAYNYSINTDAAKKIAGKTYAIQTTNSNASANFKVTLFYTKQEIDAWQQATSQVFINSSILKCPINIANGTIPNGIYGSVVTKGAYGNTQDSVISGNFTNNFGGFAMGANIIILPVTLTQFKANLFNNVVKLNWSTQAEINFKHFEIERSVDAIHFNTIARVATKGNKNQGANYIFNDYQYKETNSNQLFYRLKMVDANGIFCYSNIEVIHILGDDFAYINPQPVANWLNIFTQKQQPQQYEIYNMQGMRIMRGSFNHNAANVEVSHLPAGIYQVVILADGAEPKKIKFIKQ